MRQSNRNVNIPPPPTPGQTLVIDLLSLPEEFALCVGKMRPARWGIGFRVKTCVSGWKQIISQFSAHAPRSQVIALDHSVVVVTLYSYIVEYAFV